MRFLKNVMLSSVMNDMTINDVLFSEMAGNAGDLAIITLNRPAALNALNLNMIQQMHAQLRKWEAASHIKAVIIRAADGRAFCAGGDLRSTYQCFASHDPVMKGFFRDEYALNHYIYHYPKPYIALLDGITFGGGVGISIHGSHRIATERLLFAMPETGIGFFPDVGGTYFLPRLSNHIGFYLGLTGARINADDCVQLGIAQHKVSPDSLPDVVMAIANCEFGSDARADINDVIQAFSLPTEISTLLSENLIDHAFSKATIEDILLALKQALIHSQKKRSSLSEKSPTSLK